ncbi:hypothetical protein SLA2020_194830 [Shorea laevis]
MSGVVFFLISLFFVPPLVLSHAAVDPLIGTASHYTPIRFARTACEDKMGSSKLAPSIYPIAASERLRDRGAGCGRRFRVRCISDGAPHFCKTGEEIEVSIQDRAATMRSRASEFGVDMVIIESGFRVIAIPFARSLREQKRAALLKEKRASSSSPPRVIVLFPLSASVNLNSLAGYILKLLSTEAIGYVSSTVASSEYRLRVVVLQSPYGDLLSCMEMAADLIAFVASANPYVKRVHLTFLIHLEINAFLCLGLLVYPALLF